MKKTNILAALLLLVAGVQQAWVGCRSDASLSYAGGNNGYGYYWSRSVYNNVLRSYLLGSSSFAHRLLFNSDEIKTNTIGRQEGFSIRPVRKK